MFDIRFARSGDAKKIHQLLQEVWGESLLYDVFYNHISSSEHLVLVAVDTSKIIGFLSAFMVLQPEPRWEIDLIIVHPKSQGKGVGATLIREALTYGTCQGVYFAKASIRGNNHKSQRAFSKAGFNKDEQVLCLLTWDPLACESIIKAMVDVRFITINTLTYRGLWIEGFFDFQLSAKDQYNVIRAAQNRIFLENRLNTGMFIPECLKQNITHDLLTSAIDHGQYHHWYYTFK